MCKRKSKRPLTEKVHFSEHAIQRRLEIAGHTTDKIIKILKQDSSVETCAHHQIRKTAHAELERASALSHMQVLIFKHKNRVRRGDSAVYYYVEDSQLCYVVIDNCVVTTIPVKSNQHSTLQQIARITLNNTAATNAAKNESPKPANTINQKEELTITEVQRYKNACYDARLYLKTIAPTFNDQLGRLTLVVGLSEEGTVLTTNRLERLFRTIFSFFTYDCYRTLYDNRVVHLERGGSINPALKGKRNHVPPYSFPVINKCTTLELLTTGSPSCPTILMVDITTASQICQGLSKDVENLIIPNQESWIAYFFHGANTTHEGAMPIGNSCNFLK